MSCSKCGSENWVGGGVGWVSLMDGLCVCGICGFEKETCDLVEDTPPNLATAVASDDEDEEENTREVGVLRGLRPLLTADLMAVAEGAGASLDEKCFEMVEILSSELVEKETLLMEMDALKAKVAAMEVEAQKQKSRLVLANTKVECVENLVGGNEGLFSEMLEAAERGGTTTMEAVAVAFACQCIAADYVEPNKSKLGCELAHCINNTYNGICEVVDTEEFFDCYVGREECGIDEEAMAALPHIEMLVQMEGAAGEADTPINSVELLMGRENYLRVFGEGKDYWVVWEVN